MPPALREIVSDLADIVWQTGRMASSSVKIRVRDYLEFSRPLSHRERKESRPNRRFTCPLLRELQARAR